MFKPFFLNLYLLVVILRSIIKGKYVLNMYCISSVTANSIHFRNQNRFYESNIPCFPIYSI